MLVVTLLHFVISKLNLYCINLFEGEGFAQVIEEHDQRLRTRFPTDGCSQLLHLIQAPHW